MPAPCCKRYQPRASTVTPVQTSVATASLFSLGIEAIRIGETTWVDTSVPGSRTATATAAGSGLIDGR
jgi:hypothetical protein